MVSMVLVRLGVVCILQSVKNLGIKLCCIASEKWNVSSHQVHTPGIFHAVSKILGLPILMTVSSLTVSFEEYDRGSLSSSPYFSFKYLLFNFDIESFKLKTDGGRSRKPFFIFYFWSALILGGWGVVELNRKSPLRSAETASFCSWFDSRMEDTGWAQDFIFSSLLLINGMRSRGEFRIPIRDPRGWKP